MDPLPMDIAVLCFLFLSISAECMRPCCKISPQISKKFLQRFYIHRCFHHDHDAAADDDENYANEDYLKIMLIVIVAEADDDSWINVFNFCLSLRSTC